ncbi:MAG: hypothetical protein B7C24_06740 [Bacteroidetes bacterium 4572_77]|nr:MAG: hypothetical protein B7C24_06740 [Bacteroidetes bacterium 4572_77]
MVSCAKYEDESLIPSYIQIEKIDVSNSSSQGSSSSYISDAWVYLDGGERGTFPLPARIPLLASGKHTIKIEAGIKLNGVSATRVPYPLLEPIEMEIDLQKDSIIPVSANLRYRSNTHFEFIEDFEGANQRFESTDFGTAEWGISSNATNPSWVFEGLHSGLGRITEEDNFLQIITKDEFTNLPKNGVPVFIELDFKTNTTIILSVVGYTNGISDVEDLINLNPTEEWKKIYINLTSTLSYQPDVHVYKFLISANHNSSLDESIVLIDNFKIVYREVEK